MISSLRARWLTVLLPLLVAGCLPNDSTDDQVENGFYISIPNANLTIPSGGSTQTVVTIGRSGTFTGPIALTPIGVPGGITVSFLPDTIAEGAFTSTMTIAADSLVGSGTGTFGVRFTAAPNYIVNIAVPITTTALLSNRVAR